MQCCVPQTELKFKCSAKETDSAHQEPYMDKDSGFCLPLTVIAWLTGDIVDSIQAIDVFS